MTTTPSRRLALALGLLVASSSLPASAGTVYVPILAPGQDGSAQAVEVLVSNAAATGPRSFTALFLPADSDGTQRGAGAALKVWRGRTSVFTNPAPAGAEGLFEITAATELAVEARLAGTAAGVPVHDALPVISSRNQLAAGATAQIVGLRRDTLGTNTDVAVVNLGAGAAQCTVALVRVDGTAVGLPTSVGLPPLSLRVFDDALGLLGEQQAADVRAQVSCDRPFYAFGALFNRAEGRLSVLEPAETGASTLTPPGQGQPAPNAIVFRADGVLHQPAPGAEIRQLLVPVERALSLKRFVAELDVTPGPWTAGNEFRNHNVVWIYRGIYRGNTIANVNVFGPPRSGVKNASNVDLPARDLSQQEVPYALQQGVTYHFHYLYDAENATITLTVTQDGQTVATVQHPATAVNRTLTVPAAGLNVQFGHTAAQAAGGIEFPTYGWTYSNLRIEMTPN